MRKTIYDNKTSSVAKASAWSWSPCSQSVCGSHRTTVFHSIVSNYSYTNIIIFNLWQCKIWMFNKVITIHAYWKRTMYHAHVSQKPIDSATKVYRVRMYKPLWVLVGSWCIHEWHHTCSLFEDTCLLSSVLCSRLLSQDTVELSRLLCWSASPPLWFSFRSTTYTRFAHNTKSPAQREHSSAVYLTINTKKMWAATQTTNRSSG